MNKNKIIEWQIPTSDWPLYTMQAKSGLASDETRHCCDLPVGRLFGTFNAFFCLSLPITALLSSIHLIEPFFHSRLSSLCLVTVRFPIVRCKRPVLLSYFIPTLNFPWNWRLTLTLLDFTTSIFTFASTEDSPLLLFSIINSSSFSLLILLQTISLEYLHLLLLLHCQDSS